MIPNLIIQGGAWRIPAQDAGRSREAVTSAAEAGWQVLLAGGSALDAVEAAVVVMEDDPGLNAGRGAALNADGRIEMDAILIDGTTLNSGAVAAIPLIRNPVSVARLVMERSEHLLLVGDGALRFARDHGAEEWAEEDLIVERQLKRLQEALSAAETPELLSLFGTVGAVAIDQQGNLAAATSTGGTTGKLSGRVGDTPLLGAGAYADNRTGAASATGWGESIMKILLCRTACDLLDAGRGPQGAAREAVGILGDRVQGHGGLILLDHEGGPGIAFNTPAMARAWVKPDGSIAAEV